MVPVAGLGPATHVLEGGCVDRRKGVDDRDKPGQGDLGVVPASLKATGFSEPDSRGKLRSSLLPELR